MFRNSKSKITGGGGLALPRAIKDRQNRWQLLPTFPLPVQRGLGPLLCSRDPNRGQERGGEPNDSYELGGAGPQKVLEAEGQEEEPASLGKFKGQQKSEAKQWVKKTPAMQTGSRQEMAGDSGMWGALRPGVPSELEKNHQVETHLGKGVCNAQGTCRALQEGIGVGPGPLHSGTLPPEGVILLAPEPGLCLHWQGPSNF